MSGREYPDRPWVGIGCIVLRGEDVLLIRRGQPPLMGQWSIPGGTQLLGELTEEAARRELREEAGVEVGPLEFAFALDVVDRDAEGRVRFHYTILDYCGRWASGEPVAGDDAVEARFFPPGALPTLGLQPAVLRAVAAGRERLRG